MTLIDTHVHLYDPARLHYDWMAGDEVLESPHLLGGYREAADGVGVTGLVFVEVDCRDEEGIAEAEWIASLAADPACDPPILGIVAFAPVETDGIDGHLDRLAEVPGVKGVRRLLQTEPVELLSTPSFRRGLDRVGRRGLTFDICCTSAQLAAVNDLVASLPDVAFVLDHLGNPDAAGGEWEPWASQIGLLAAQDNVRAAKLSGFLTKGTAASAARYLAHMLDTFGPSRLMVGSDWPVCDLGGSLPEWMSVVTDAVAGLGSSEQDDIRAGTATRTYRLDPSG